MRIDLGIYLNGIIFIFKTNTATIFNPNSYIQFSQICARTLRNALKEQARLAADKRGVTTIRFQKWENGKGGQQVGYTFY